MMEEGRSGAWHFVLSLPPGMGSEPWVFKDNGDPSLGAVAFKGPILGSLGTSGEPYPHGAWFWLAKSPDCHLEQVVCS